MPMLWIETAKLLPQYPVSKKLPGRFSEAGARVPAYHNLCFKVVLDPRPLSGLGTFEISKIQWFVNDSTETSYFIAGEIIRRYVKSELDLEVVINGTKFVRL